MPMTNRQIPKDGYGKEKTIIGSGVRLTAKNLEKSRSTTLKITGVDSGAVQYVNILVQTGTPARFANPSSPPREGRDSRQRDTRERDTRDTRERDTRDTRERDTRDTRERDTRDTRERDTQNSRRETSRTR
jgi:hypothetical protein